MATATFGSFGSTPGFGAFGASNPAAATAPPSAAPSLFGSSAPAFGTSGATGSLFGFGGQQQQPASLFGTPQPAQQQQQQQQQQQPNGLQPNALITYSSKFEDLHPDRQKELQEIQ